MGFELPVDSIVLTDSALLLAGVLIAGSSSRFPIPASILSLGLGMLVGSDLLGWIYLDDAELVRDMAVIALIVILFEGGLTTRPGALRQGGAVGFLLSNLGVVITGGMVALAVRTMLSTDWATALVIGAVVSSTDAAAVFDLLRRAPSRVGWPGSWRWSRAPTTCSPSCSPSASSRVSTAYRRRPTGSCSVRRNCSVDWCWAGR